MSLMLFLSSDDSLPLHQRLMMALIDAITSSRMPPGSAVPSSRELAETLGISRATVTKAYAELARKKFIVTKPSGKTHVADTIPAEGSAAPLQMAQRVDVPEAAGKTPVSQFAARLMTMNLVTNWGQTDAAPPKRLLPTHQWKSILSKYCSLLQANSNTSHPFGEANLRTTVARLLARTRGVNCDPNQVVTFAESQSGVNIISQVLLEKGDLVVVEDPCFVNARNLFLAHGAQVLSIPIDEQGLRVDLLNERVPAGKTVKLIYVSPTFHDPTGVCMSLARRHELLKFARAHNSLIVEETWDGSHSYVKEIPPPLHALSKDANVFYLCSFWKVLYPLSMVSCLVVPEPYVPFFLRAKMISQEASPGIEHTLEDFIESGMLEKHLKQVVRTLTPARQKVIETLLVTFRQADASAMTIRRQSSAYWLTVQFSESLQREEIFATAQAAGLTLYSTSRFYADPQTAPSNEFIVPFATESTLQELAAKTNDLGEASE